MSWSSFHSLYKTIISHVPLSHWVIICVLSLSFAIGIHITKKYSLYSVIAFGITTFFCLFLLETAVLIRYCGLYPHGSGYDFVAEYHRLLSSTESAWIEYISNVAVFLPFGFFLSEFFSSTKHLYVWRQIGCVTIITLLLSLCIECFQLFLNVGYFELSDIFMNTLGGLLGANLALIVRRIIKAK